MDRHSISIYDSEKCRNILSQLPGIFAIRLHFGNGDNSVKDQLTEIHVLASTDRNPKQIARDIQSTLFAVYGAEIDHRIISIAQLPQNPFSAPQPTPSVHSELKSEAVPETKEETEEEIKEEIEEEIEAIPEIEPEIERAVEPEPTPQPKPVPQIKSEVPSTDKPDGQNGMYMMNRNQNNANDAVKETRLLFTGIDSSHNNGCFDVNVHLTCDGHDYSGTGHCRDTIAQCNRIVAQATAQAVNTFLGKDYFNPLEVKLVNIWDVTVAVTLIEFQEKDRTDPIMLVGAAAVKDNSFSGIVRSTLDGLNRCINKILPTHISF